MFVTSCVSCGFVPAPGCRGQDRCICCCCPVSFSLLVDLSASFFNLLLRWFSLLSCSAGSECKDKCQQYENQKTVEYNLGARNGFHVVRIADVKPPVYLYSVLGLAVFLCQSVVGGIPLSRGCSVRWFRLAHRSLSRKTGLVVERGHLPFSEQVFPR